MISNNHTGGGFHATPILNSPEAEQSVLGGLMLDNSKLAEVCALVTADNFYDKGNRLIFEAIVKLANEQKAFDMVLISQVLKDEGKLADAGGDGYIFSLANDTPSALNILEYAQVVKQKSLERKTVLYAEQLKQNPQDIGSIVPQLEKIQSLANSENSYPLPVNLESSSLLTIPPNILPSWFGEMVEAVATATETSRELPLMTGLAVLATCCQNTFVVSPEKGYTEQLSIWTCAIADVSDRKSTVTAKMVQPLIDWERTKAEELKPEILLKKSLCLTAEKKVNTLRKQAAEANNAAEADKLQQEIFDVEKNMPEIPTIPRLWTQDVTPEKVALLLAENNGRISAISAESGLIDTLAGRYSNNVPNLDIFLQAYSGDAVRVDRMGREPVFIDHPALTLGLSAQPDVLRSLNSKQEFRGRGLLARFLFVMIQSMVGRRKLENKPIPEHIKTKYQQSINSLLNIKTDEPIVLKFSPEAYQEWKAFALFIEKESGEGGKFEHARDLAGKLAGAAARLAGLLHCVSFADCAYFADRDNHFINLETMKIALLVLSILIEHSLSVLYLMGLDCKQNDALKILHWIKKNKQKQFTARDCFNDLRGHYAFKRMESVNAALDVLVERNYIFKPNNKNEQASVGRPSSPKFIVNPHLTEGW